MRDEFITKLDLLRERCGFPLRVNSGYRCPEYNKAVSTTGLAGPHTTGNAVDLGVDRGLAFKVMVEAARTGEFTGFGFSQKGTSRFIHLDDLAEPEHSPRPTIWTY